MACKGPSDGWAYTPIELIGIMNIPVTQEDILAGLERRWRWFRHQNDCANANIILQSLVADMDDLDRATWKAANS